MPSTKGGSLNGGVIGTKVVTSFGKNKQTVQTSSGTLTTLSGTRLIDFAVVAGGAGGGGGYRAGAGGAGGLQSSTNVSVCGSTDFSITVGAGGAGGSAPDGGGAAGSNSVFNCVTSTGGGAGAGGYTSGPTTGGNGCFC